MTAYPAGPPRAGCQSHKFPTRRRTPAVPRVPPVPPFEQNPDPMLARRGFEPRHSFKGQSLAVKWGPLELGDIANSVRLRTVLEQYRPAALMHFAAYACVGESVEDPLLYYQNNVAASAAVLQTLLSFETYLSFSHQHVRLMGRPKRSPFPRTIHSVPLIHTGIPNWSSNACSPISTRRAACDRSRFGTSMLRVPIPMVRSVRP